MATNSIQLNSYAARGLNMEQALRTVEGDRLVMRAGKFAAGTTLTVATAAFAAFETLLSAAAILATLPVSYFVPQRYAAIKTHTADSARTVALATRRTFGAEITSPANKAAKVAPSRVEQFKTLAREKVTRALQFSKENKTALIASTIAVTVMSAYYFGLFDYAASLVQSAPQAKKAAQVIAKKAATLSPMGPHLPSSLQPVVNRPDHTFVASKAAAKLFTEGQSGMVVSDAYSKLLTEGKFPTFVPKSIAAITSKAATSLPSTNNTKQVAKQFLVASGCAVGSAALCVSSGGPACIVADKILMMCGLALGAA